MNNWLILEIRFCYDQGLGETLAQHGNETPPLLSPKHHQQLSILKWFNSKDILYTTKHAGSLGQQGRASRKWSLGNQGIQ